MLELTHLDLFKAAFILADTRVNRWVAIVNQYNPDSRNAWYEAHTELGMMVVGRRHR
jgi:hypothetical protein